MMDATEIEFDFDALSDAGRDLVLSAAVRERFRPSALIDTWLGRQGADLSEEAMAEAIEVSLTLGDISGTAAESTSGAALPLPLRRHVLASAGRSKAQAALAREGARTRVERSFADLVAGRVPDTKRLSRSELLALSMAARWAEGLDGAAKLDAGEIKRQMAAQQFVERVGGSDLPLFVGREGLLNALNEIWRLEDRPTVMIEGPAGIGKSIAVARFFQMVLQSDDPVVRPDAILHLDFDLPQMQRASAIDMAIEIVRQFALRWWVDLSNEPRADELSLLRGFGTPNAATRMSRLLRALGPSEESTRSKSQSTELRDSRRWSSPEDILAEALAVFHDTMGRAPRIIFFADSFERAELLDEVSASNVSLVVDALRTEDADCMVIYAARAYQRQHLVESYRRTSRMPVKRFTQGEAVDYLIGKARERGMRLTRAEAARANQYIRGWPLGLRIAVSMLGTSSESFDAEAWLGIIETDGKTAQATLYERLLDRIEDEHLRRLAKPGLLVRRISADVISSVLAGPCDLPPDIDAAQLMDKAEIEGQLFWRDTADPGALWHRQDLRAIMLPILQGDVPVAVAKAINDNAVAYYASVPGDIARGEELYHRLCRGDTREQVAARWTLAAGQRLVGSLAELPADGAATARLLLGGGRSDVSGGLEELRAVARNRLSDDVTDLTDLFQAGGIPEGLLSPLGDVYALKLSQEGRFDELLDGAEILQAGRDLPPDVMARIAISAAGIAEGMGELQWALSFWRRAYKGAAMLDFFERLSVLVALARVPRKIGSRTQGRYRRVLAACNLLVDMYMLDMPLGAIRLEALAELSEVLHPERKWHRRANPEVYRVLPVLFRDLSPMFPSAMQSRERIDALAGLLGIPAAQVHTPSDLDGLMYKFFNSSEADDHRRAMAALRSEVDASYAAVIKRASYDRSENRPPTHLAY